MNHASSLPTELLLHIFEEAIQDTRIPGRPSISTITISQVCRRWRAITTYGTELWRCIDSRCVKLREVRHYLHMSGARGLDIVQFFDNDSPLMKNEVLARMLGLHARRWRSLEWSDKSDDSLNAVTHVLRNTNHFPRLEYLSVETAALTFLEETDIVSPNVDSAYPVLRELSLCRLHPTMLHAGPLPALQRLSMQSFHAITSSELLVFLSRAPSLLRLELESFQPIIDAPLAPHQPLPISTLSWTYAPVVDMWRFFLFLKMPELVSLTLGVSINRYDAHMYQDLDGRVARLTDEDNTRLGIAPDTVVTLDKLHKLRIKYSGLKANGITHDMDLVIRRTRFPNLRSLGLQNAYKGPHLPILPLLSRIIERQPFDHLEFLAIQHFDLQADRFRRMLSALPALRILVLWGCRQSGAAICELVPGQCVHGHGRGRLADNRNGNEVEEWLCPRLRTLNVEDSDDLRIECVMRVVEARAQAASQWKDSERASASSEGPQEGRARSVLGDLPNVGNDLSPTESKPQSSSKSELPWVTKVQIKRCTYVRLRRCAQVSKEDAMELKGLMQSSGRVDWEHCTL